MFKKEEREDAPSYILVDRINRKVWHEQYGSWNEAKAKIDFEKNNGVVGNWVIEKLYGRKETNT